MKLLEYKKICCICNKEFISHSNKSKFCSNLCICKKRNETVAKFKINNPEEFKRRNIIYNENRQKKLTYILLKHRKYMCKVCNIEFIPNSSVQTYCSYICHMVAEKKRTLFHVHNPIEKPRRNEIYKNFYRRKKGYEPIKEINCIICNKIFLRKNITQKYCNNNECKLKYLSQKALKNYYQNKQEFLDRRKRNINGKLLNILRVYVNTALKYYNAKKSNHTINLIGCTIEELKVHLEKQFKPGMNWNNHSVKGWHIDHIIPTVVFNLIEEEQQKLCFHYTNLQPLWARENLQKSKKVEELVL